jgi:hypothetical protein
VGPQDPKDVTRDTACDLSALVGELAALKGDATHWLTDPEYGALRHCLEAAHAAAETALVQSSPGPLRRRDTIRPLSPPGDKGRSGFLKP